MEGCAAMLAFSLESPEVEGYGRPAVSADSSCPKRNSVAESRVNLEIRSYISFEEVCVSGGVNISTET